MAEAVFVSCALASILCAALLWRSYRSQRVGLLFWASVCFAWLAVNNLLLFVDKVLVEDTDLAAWRGLSGLIGFAALVYGMVWERR